MYFESVKQEKSYYERKGVLTGLRISNEAYEAERVEVLVDDEIGELVILEAEDVTARHCCLLNRVGFYANIRTDFDVIFIDTETFLILPSTGVIFLKAETEESEIDIATLDVDNALGSKSVYSSLVKWITPEYILNLIKGGTMGDAWGLLSHKYPFDYIYSFSVMIDKEKGFSIKCIGFDDISLGMIGKVARSLELLQYREQMRIFHEREVAERAIQEHKKREEALIREYQENSKDEDFYDEDEDDEEDFAPRRASREEEEYYY